MNVVAVKSAFSLTKLESASRQLIVANLKQCYSLLLAPQIETDETDKIKHIETDKKDK